jgi:hypothetical protein
MYYHSLVLLILSFTTIASIEIYFEFCFVVSPKTERKTDLTADDAEQQNCDNQGNTNEGVL